MTVTENCFPGNSLRPRLLVSVQNAAEAHAAMSGGAEILDVKDPRQGSLGRPTLKSLRQICDARRDIPGDSSPLSVAMGELRDGCSLQELAELLPSFTWVKVGLSHSEQTSWQVAWQDLQSEVHRLCSPQTAPKLIPVVYADWSSCRAPSPESVLEMALASDAPGVLFDTFTKDGRTLLDHVSFVALEEWIAELHRRGRFVALAGRIHESHLPDVVRLHPDIIAVRSAVCVDGRLGRVAAEKVAAFRQAITQAFEVNTSKVC